MIRECRCEPDVVRCVHARGHVVLLIRVPGEGWQLEYTHEGGRGQGDIWRLPAAYYARYYGDSPEPHHDALDAFNDWAAHLITSHDVPEVTQSVTSWDDIAYTDPERWERENADHTRWLMDVIRGDASG